MARLSKRHFWEWFSRHSKEYLDLRKKSKKEMTYWTNELTTHLRAYYKFLDFIIEFKKNENCILTITVEGKHMHFKKVDDLVSKAFEIPGWTIQALDSPKPIDFMIGELIEEAGIDPTELVFANESDYPYGGLLNVFHPMVTKQNKYLVAQIAKYAAYNLLGERVFGNEIYLVEVYNLSQAEKRYELLKMETLPEYIDQRKSRVVVDENGNLVSAD